MATTTNFELVEKLAPPIPVFGSKSGVLGNADEEFPTLAALKSFVTRLERQNIPYVGVFKVESKYEDEDDEEDEDGELIESVYYVDYEWKNSESGSCRAVYAKYVPVDEEDDDEEDDE